MSRFSTTDVVFVVLLLCAISACSPYNFTLQRNTGWEIEGKIRGNHHLVETRGNNTVLLKPNGMAYMRCYQITDGQFDTEIQQTNLRQTVDENQPVVSFAFRSTPHSDTVTADTAQMVTVDIYTAFVTVSGPGVAKHIDLTNAISGEPFEVAFLQHGRYLDATVACTNLGRIELASPSTQWVRVTAGTNNGIILRDPVFRPWSDAFALINGVIPR